MNAPRIIFPLLLLPAIPVVLGACTTFITPPAQPESPVRVYLADYGRHASLLLPEPGSDALVEYAYGDWRWFALDESRTIDLFPTLLWPTQGTLGRWRWTIDDDPEAIRRAVACEEVLPITVGAAETAALLADLDARFDQHHGTLHYQPLYHLNFVHDDAAYHALHNCNHVTAQWLRELGCDVRGFAMFALFEVTEPR